MIEQVQAVADGAVKVMSHSREQVERSVSRTADANAALSGSGEAIHRISEMSHQIAIAAEEQSAVSTEVIQSVHRMVQMGQETGRNATKTAQAGESLDQLSVQRKGLVSRCKA